MIRTQISLVAAQMDRARALARRRGVSLAALVRAALERELAFDGPGPAEGVAQLRDRYGSGASDVAERHDDYLADGDDAGW